MPHACILLRPTLTYRRDAFERGLRRVGYEPSAVPKAKPEPDDLLVLWNRKPTEERIARTYEAAGARVVIAENGYIGKGPDGGKLYALALGHHNGCGTWPTGGPQRWQALGIDLKPWRTSGDFILVLAQRGIGEAGVAMPPGWLARTLADLGKRTKRPVRIRRHPGREKVEPDADFAVAWACVTWGSGAGIKALAQGVPVFHDLAGWIGAPMSAHGLDDLESPYVGPRLAAFQRLAWAQVDIEEIASGDAFARLLER